MIDLEQRIEDYLLEATGDGWIKSKVLCARFEIKERQLRKVGSTPGLCSGFAISGDKGFKHVKRASKTEFLRFKHGMRKHAVSELRRVRDLDQRRHQVTTTIKRPAITTEKDSGQVLLFDLPSTALPF